eukprot:2879218-Rhodomonas_salina.2
MLFILVLFPHPPPRRHPRPHPSPPFPPLAPTWGSLGFSHHHHRHGSHLIPPNAVPPRAQARAVGEYVSAHPAQVPFDHPVLSSLPTSGTKCAMYHDCYAVLSHPAHGRY